MNTKDHVSKKSVFALRMNTKFTADLGGPSQRCGTSFQATYWNSNWTPGDLKR